MMVSCTVYSVQCTVYSGEADLQQVGDTVRPSPCGGYVGLSVSL